MEQKHIDLIDQWCEKLEENHRLKWPSLPDRYFVFKINKKYTRISSVDTTESVHAFIDNDTLDVYKPATWKAPYKKKRYNLVEDFDEIIANCHKSGYLYERGYNNA